MTDTYREVEIPLVRMTRPYARQLETRVERLDEQIEAFDKEIDGIYDKAQPSLDALGAKVPETDGAPTAVEFLTARAARADLDVALCARDVHVAEARVKHAQAVAERDNLIMRLGQVDHVAENGDPVLSPGNDDMLAIWTLAAQEATIELAAAEAVLSLTSKRLEHAKKARREIQSALRAQKRSDERGAKK